MLLKFFSLIERSLGLKCYHSTEKQGYCDLSSMKHFHTRRNLESSGCGFLGGERRKRRVSPWCWAGRLSHNLEIHQARRQPVEEGKERGWTFLSPAGCSGLNLPLTLLQTAQGHTLAGEATLTNPDVKHHQWVRMKLQNAVESAEQEGEVECVPLSPRDARVWKMFQVWGEQSNYWLACLATTLKSFLFRENSKWSPDTKKSKHFRFVQY